MATTSSLTWFEEWFLFFEMVWGRLLLCWTDADRTFKIEKKICRRIFERKLSLVRCAVQAWPRFVFHSEDMKLHSQKWRNRYRDKRVIMWDNTNVDFLGKPSDPDLQRLTYLLYYGGNIAKGGIFLQLCGWLGGWELWHGVVSDSDYMERSGVLEFQQQFQNANMLGLAATLAFFIILDKGYHIVLAAWQNGGQFLLQPFFAKSDRKFTSKEVLCRELWPPIDLEMSAQSND